MFFLCKLVALTLSIGQGLIFRDLGIKKTHLFVSTFMGSQTDDLPAFQLPKLTGSVPGLLDSTQPARLLRLPGSKLSFATFDPHAASGSQDVPNLCTLSLNEELYRPKRIVIETLPSGESFWRFVPKARLEEGISDEGKWPRIIEICG
jgi:hypothetical protein